MALGMEVQCEDDSVQQHWQPGGGGGGGAGEWKAGEGRLNISLFGHGTKKKFFCVELQPGSVAGSDHLQCFFSTFFLHDASTLLRVFAEVAALCRNLQTRQSDAGATSWLP